MRETRYGKYFTTKDAGEYLGVKRCQVWRLIKRGWLPSIHTPMGNLLRKEDLDRYLEERLQQRMEKERQRELRRSRKKTP